MSRWVAGYLFYKQSLKFLEAIPLAGLSGDQIWVPNCRAMSGTTCLGKEIMPAHVDVALL